MSKEMVNEGELRKETFEDGEGQEALPDYEGYGADSEDGEAGKKGLAVRSTGFNQFMLNKEVYRAVVENGFEHPSEGTFVYRVREMEVFFSAAQMHTTSFVRTRFGVSSEKRYG